MTIEESYTPDPFETLSKENAFAEYSLTLNFKKSDWSEKISAGLIFADVWFWKNQFCMNNVESINAFRVSISVSCSEL